MCQKAREPLKTKTDLVKGTGMGIKLGPCERQKEEMQLTGTGLYFKINKFIIKDRGGGR